MQERWRDQSPKIVWSTDHQAEITILMHGVNQILAIIQSPEESALHPFCINDIFFLAQLKDKKAHQTQLPESNMIWTINSIDLFLGWFDKVLFRSSKLERMKGVKLPLLQWDVLLFLSSLFLLHIISDGYKWNSTFHIYTLRNVCKIGPNVLY